MRIGRGASVGEWKITASGRRSVQGRVPNASGGHSGWVFRRLTVPDQKMTEGKSVGDVPTDVFELKKFSGAGGSRRAPKRAGGGPPVWNGRVGYQLVRFDAYIPKMKIKLKNDENFGTYVQKINFFEVGKICEKLCRDHFSGSYSSYPRTPMWNLTI